MREEDLGRYQMLWDCPACGAEGLLGLDHSFCPSCGTAQDPSSRYFPSDEQKILVEDHPYHGADKVCPACDTPNSATSDFCQACGSPLDEARAAARRDDKVVGEGESFDGESASDARAEARARKQAEEAERRARMAGQEPDKPAKKRGGIAGLGLVGTGCAVIFALLVVGCVGFFTLQWLLGSSGEVTVQGHAWKRSVAIESYGPTEKKDWRTEVPAGARIQSCREVKKDSKKVEDGEDCKVVKKDKGDGTFSEKKVCTPTYKTVDVMAEKCTYVVDTWSTARTEQAAGTDLSPAWPEVRLGQTGTCRGCEREGKRTETYTLLLTGSDGARHSCDVPEATWRRLEDGDEVEATFGGLTGAIDCSSL